MNNPFEEIFKRLENIEKMISPVGSSSSEEPDIQLITSTT